MAKPYQIIGSRPVLDAGALRNVITIQRKAIADPPTFDTAGVATTWENFTTARCAIESVNGTDVIRGGQTTSQQFLTIAMWWQSGVLPSMRVLTTSGSVFEIQSVENALEQNVVMVLNCIALGPNT